MPLVTHVYTAAIGGVIITTVTVKHKDYCCYHCIRVKCPLLVMKVVKDVILPVFLRKDAFILIYLHFLDIYCLTYMLPLMNGFYLKRCSCCCYKWMDEWNIRDYKVTAYALVTALIIKQLVYKYVHLFEMLQLVQI